VEGTKTWSWIVSGAWIPLATRVVLAIVVVVMALALARLAGTALRRLRARSTASAPSIYIVEKLVSYGLVIAGGFLGLSTLGVNLTSLAVFFGAVGVGVGLGLQGIVREFVSGLVLIFDRVLNVGDFIEVAETRGVVQEIGPRAVRIRTNDRVDLIVPNSKFIDGPVVNWTLHGEGRRIHVPFSVASDADRTAVREVVLQAARSVPFTLPETDDHKSQVWLTGFGDNGLNFELLVWPTLVAVKRPGAMLAAYNWAIADALDQAGIEIPYPQMEVRIRSLFGQEGRDALAALKLEAPAAASARAADPQPSHNDAAAELARPMAGPEPAADD
jgi:small-conductance mechanosensitive channel